MNTTCVWPRATAGFRSFIAIGVTLSCASCAQLTGEDNRVSSIAAAPAPRRPVPPERWRLPPSNPEPVAQPAPAPLSNHPPTAQCTTVESLLTTAESTAVHGFTVVHAQIASTPAERVAATNSYGRFGVGEETRSITFEFSVLAAADWHAVPLGSRRVANFVSSISSITESGARELQRADSMNGRPGRAPISAGLTVALALLPDVTARGSYAVVAAYRLDNGMLAEPAFGFPTGTPIQSVIDTISRRRSALRLEARS